MAMAHGVWPRAARIRGLTWPLALFGALALGGAPEPAHAHGDLHRQIADVTARIAHEPDRAALYLKRGELHRVHRDWAAALADYDRAAALDATLAAVHVGRAAVWLETDRPAAALEAAERALGGEPARAEPQADARVLKARALTRLGRDGEAADEWGRAIAALGRPRPDHFVERARAFVDAGRPGEALASLDEGSERLGPVVSLDLLAIELEIRLSRVDAALARVERQAAATPRKETWLLRRGEILEAAGRPAEARAAYAAALQALEAAPVARRHTRAMEDVRERSTAGLARTGRPALRAPDPGDR